MVKLTLSQCRDLNDLQKILMDHPGPIIGKKGGRKFMINSQEVTMNAIVLKFLELVKETPFTKGSADSAAAIANKIDSLNRKTVLVRDDKAAKKLAYRQKWGNRFARLKHGSKISKANYKTEVYKILLKKYFQDYRETGIPAVKLLLSEVKDKLYTRPQLSYQRQRLADHIPDEDYIIKLSKKLKLNEQKADKIANRLFKPILKRINPLIKDIDRYGAKLEKG